MTKLSTRVEKRDKHRLTAVSHKVFTLKLYTAPLTDGKLLISAPVTRLVGNSSR